MRRVVVGRQAREELHADGGKYQPGIAYDESVACLEKTDFFSRDSAIEVGHKCEVSDVGNERRYRHADAKSHKSLAFTIGLTPRQSNPPISLVSIQKCESQDEHRVDNYTPDNRILTHIVKHRHRGYQACQRAPKRALRQCLQSTCALQNGLFAHKHGVEHHRCRQSDKTPAVGPIAEYRLCKNRCKSTYHYSPKQSRHETPTPHDSDDECKARRVVFINGNISDGALTQSHIGEGRDGLDGRVVHTKQPHTLGLQPHSDKFGLDDGAKDVENLHP